MSKTIYKVRMHGVGQLNGPVNIDKTIEVDQSMVGKFSSNKRDEVILSVINTHYPSVKVNPKQIGITITQGDSRNYKTKSKNEISNRKSESSSFLFLPFKIIWFLIKLPFKILDWVGKV
ncbi:MAG: hypothetical protein IT271_07260 [Chitinophagales bacterium]|jgi:hypothetical protein|nr:hypothetical protein [Chitinophagales bacterium]